MYAIPVNQVEEIEFILHHLKIVQAGTPFITAKHDKLIPEHAAALSIELQKNHFQHIEVNLKKLCTFYEKNQFNWALPQKVLHLSCITNFHLVG